MVLAASLSDKLPIAFIIECNNSSVYAASLLRAARQIAFPNPVMNPFTSENFSAEITPEIGPWTTHANKFAMVEETLVALLDRRLTVNPHCVTVGHEVINPKIKPTSLEDALVVLSRELKRVADDGKTISGKAGGLDDDAAMALFLAVYWYAYFCAHTQTVSTGSFILILLCTGQRSYASSRWHET